MKPETLIHFHRIAKSCGRTALCARIEERLLKQFEPMLKQIVRPWVRTNHQFDDLMQEARIALLRAIDLYQADRSPFGYYVRLWVLNTVRRFAARDHSIALRQWAFKQPGALPFTMNMDISDADESVAAPEALDNEAYQILFLLHTQLESPVQQYVIFMLYFADPPLTPSLLAERMHCSAQNIYGIRNRAVENMRAIWLDFTDKTDYNDINGRDILDHDEYG